MNKVSWMMGGQAGFGIVNAGVVFSRCCSRGGLHVFDRTSYPSLIRGGHNNLHVRVEDEQIHSHIRPIDILVALNKETVDKQKGRLNDDAVIIYDPDDFTVSEADFPKKVVLCPVNLLKIAEEKGLKIMRNTVAIGATLGLLDYPFSYLEKVLTDMFQRKGDKVVASNVAVAKAGYDVAKETCASKCKFKLQPVDGQPKRFIVSGAEAIGIGAIKAGVKMVSGYPMTPGTPSMEFIASKESEYGIVIKHTEDEIAAMAMMSGAGFAGIRSFNATAGGGFALMSEALSMAGMVETPVVSLIAMRGGPSTGLPTHTEQSDLDFVLYTGHGEFPRIVVAPGDPEDAFYDTFKLFNLAEKYQCPGLILSDKHLQTSHQALEFYDHKDMKVERGKLLSDSEVAKNTETRFKRFAFTDDGVSPRVLPGQKGGIHRVTGNEHDEYGLTTEDPDNRRKMVEKRLKKIETMMPEIPLPVLYGAEDADMTVICWGSTKGMALEAMKWLEKEGKKVNVLHFTWLCPFPAVAVKEIIGNCKRLLLVEQNATSQFGRLLREKCLIDIPDKLLKYDGSPFYPEEIYDKVKSLI
ncbi:2-oxoacid:acceptor oxidoreductase subunit alpha [Thermoproteota archaeon]